MDSEFSKKAEVTKQEPRHYEELLYTVDAEIPKIAELKSDKRHKFTVGFPENQEGETWITKLDEGNHQSFIYAMIVYAKDIYDPEEAVSQQFWRNLEQIQKTIKDKMIKVTAVEDLALRYLNEDMKNQSAGSRSMFLESMILDFERTFA